MPIIDARAPRSIKLGGSRFVPQKRAKINHGHDESINFASYNSGFLNGLFDDVAKSEVLSEFRIQSKRGPHLISSDGSDYLPMGCPADVSLENDSNNCAVKKCRLSLSRSSVKARPSYKNLSAIVVGCPSSEARMGAGVSNEPGTASPDGGEEAVPHLPATVSDSSCSAGISGAKLNQGLPADLPLSDNANPVGSFGWFVDLDEGEYKRSRDISAAKSPDDLAFQASTAPKRVDDKAEVEWAQAADTIDNVLGEFF